MQNWSFYIFLSLSIFLFALFYNGLKKSHLNSTLSFFYTQISYLQLCQLLALQNYSVKNFNLYTESNILFNSSTKLFNIKFNMCIQKLFTKNFNICTQKLCNKKILIYTPTENILKLGKNKLTSKRNCFGPGMFFIITA